MCTAVLAVLISSVLVFLAVPHLLMQADSLQRDTGAALQLLDDAAVAGYTGSVHATLLYEQLADPAESNRTDQLPSLHAALCGSLQTARTVPGGRLPGFRDDVSPDVARAIDNVCSLAPPASTEWVRAEEAMPYLSVLLRRFEAAQPLFNGRVERIAGWYGSTALSDYLEHSRMRGGVLVGVYALFAFAFTVLAIWRVFLGALPLRTRNGRRCGWCWRNRVVAAFVALLGVALLGSAALLVLDNYAALTATHSGSASCASGVKSTLAQHMCILHTQPCAVPVPAGTAPITAWCPDALQQCRQSVWTAGDASLHSSEQCMADARNVLHHRGWCGGDSAPYEAHCHASLQRQLERLTSMPWAALRAPAEKEWVSAVTTALHVGTQEALAGWRQADTIHRGVRWPAVASSILALVAFVITVSYLPKDAVNRGGGQLSPTPLARAAPGSKSVHWLTAAALQRSQVNPYDGESSDSDDSAP